MKKHFILSAIASGILMAAAFPPSPLHLIAFLAFVPLLTMLRHEVKHKYLYVYITFFFYHLGTNWWISSFQEKTDPFLMATGFALDFLHPLFFFVPFIVFFFIQKRVSYKIALLSFPFVWTAFEWLHSLGDLGYAWLSIGITQINFLGWIQFIDITGIFGASFLIMIVNVILSMFVIKTRETEFSFGKIMKMKKLWTISFVLVFALPGIYGFVSLAGKYTHKKMIASNDLINVAMIQPNFDPWDKWDITPHSMIKKYQEIEDSLHQSINAPIDLTIWSETAIPYISNAFNAEHETPVLNRQVNKYETSLLTGFADFEFYDIRVDSNIAFDTKLFQPDTNYRYQSYNGAMLINPTAYDTTPSQLYHKMKLTPFAERIPYYEHLGFMEKFMNWGVGISSWGKGAEQHNLTLYPQDSVSYEFAPIICIESIFPDFVRKFTKQGANFLTIITNDSWYDHTTGPAQHWNIARVRAIENRRYVARTANSGVSGVIAANGKEILKLEKYRATAGVASIPILEDKSFYVKHGDWLAKTCGIISLIILIFSLVWVRIKSENSELIEDEEN